MTSVSQLWREGNSGVCAPIVSLARVAEHRSKIVGKNAGHWLQVTDIAIDHAEQCDDGGLVGGDAVEIAHKAYCEEPLAAKSSRPLEFVLISYLSGQRNPA